MKKITIPFFVTSALAIGTFMMFENLETYFSNLLKTIEHQHFTYSLVSFLVLSSDIVLPVPASIVMYTNGFILGVGSGTLLSLISVLAGALLGYFLGQFTSMGLRVKQDRKTELFLDRYGAIAILVSRGIPILSESVCIVCGYNRFDLKTYLLLNVVGYIPICLLYAYFGSIAFDKYSFLISFGCSLLIGGVFYMLAKKYLKSSKPI